MRWHAKMLLAGVLLGGLVEVARGEITLDGTWGSGTLMGPEVEIHHDLGHTVGGNLFHSFETFGIGPGESATFTGPTSIENILSRVTGGEASTIDGLLRSSIPGADLFFLNPAGVVFGPQARLEVGGAFHASTADYLRLGRSGRFDVSQPGNSQLSAAPPSAFGFLTQTPAAIRFQGSGSALWEQAGLELEGVPWRIAVPEGEALSAIGGSLALEDARLLDTFEVESRLLAPGGVVNLVSVASPAEVTIGPSGIDASAVGQLGEIRITGASVIDVSGSPGGDIYLRGGRLVVQDSSALLSFTTGDRDGGAIDIGAGSVELANAGFVFSGPSGASGNGSDIVVQASRLEMRDGSQIATVVLCGEASCSTGDGGNLSIEANTVLLTSGAAIFSQVFAGNDGDAGTLRVTAREGLEIRDVANCAALGRCAGIGGNTAGAGDAADIAVEAGEIRILGGGSITSGTLGSGDGGTVRVKASGAIHMAGGASIGTTTVGTDAELGVAGDAGQVSISAPLVRMDGFNTIDSSTIGDGDAGSVRLEVEDLSLRGGGQIRSMSGGLDRQTGEPVVGTGRGGEVVVAAGGQISITGQSPDGEPSGILTTTSGDGRGGDIRLMAQRMELRDGATISAKSFAGGRAGNIDVVAQDTFASFEGEVTTEAVEADGGDIAIQAGKLVRAVNGAFTTSILGAGGTGGNIRIDPRFVVLQEASHVLANARNPLAQRAGNIVVAGDYLFLSADTRIEASGPTEERNGQIVLRGLEADISGGIVPLPASFLDAPPLSNRHCAVHSAGSQSSLTHAGRGGLPPGPDGYLPSLLGR